MKSGPLKWHGGKAYLAKRIIELMPPHTRYCEPYFGGGAVLLQKPCDGVAEFANDINGELMQFWCVLKDGYYHNKFIELCNNTPLSEAGFASADVAGVGTPVKRAWAFFVRNRQSRQGLGKDFCTPTKRLRRGMNENVSAWLSAVDGLPEFHARLRRVEIRCQPALEFIRELDSPETLFYCDPPYLHETRGSTGEYGLHEMTVEQHETLLHHLHRIKGKFILSGYMNRMYDSFAAVACWHRVDIEIPNNASSAKTKEIKTECLWANYEIH